MGDKYDNKLIGIEAGAGLTAQTKDSAIPKYELDNLEFTTSSTPARHVALVQLRMVTPLGATNCRFGQVTTYPKR